MAFFRAPFFASPFFNTGPAEIPAGPPRVIFTLAALPAFALDAAAPAFVLPASSTTFILEPAQ